jgi:hypothetical protein
MVGRVVKGADGVPGVPVTIHRVTQDSSGVVAQLRSDPSGTFRFTLPPVDTTAGFAVFFATADYQAVRYFGAPLHRDEPRTDYRVVVYDTTSEAAAAQSIRTVRRDLVMLPTSDGGWEVNEVVRLRNTGDRTLVSASGMPTWGFHIPAAATDFEAGEGEAQGGEVSRMGDRVLVLASLVPGDRELFVRYRLPGDAERELSVAGPADTLNVFVRQPAAPLTVQGATRTQEVEAQGERFMQYGALGLAEGASLRVSWSGTGPPVDPIVAAVALTLLLLAGGSWAALRGRRAPPSRAPAGAAAR